MIKVICAGLRAERTKGSTSRTDSADDTRRSGFNLMDSINTLRKGQPFKSAIKSREAKGWGGSWISIRLQSSNFIPELQLQNCYLRISCHGSHCGHVLISFKENKNLPKKMFSTKTRQRHKWRHLSSCRARDGVGAGDVLAESESSVHHVMDIYLLRTEPPERW